jgi:hypothetical protein
MTGEMDNQPGHVCDWRVHGRYQHNLVVICVADGHNINWKCRLAPLVPDEGSLPHYDGKLDLHHDR